MPRTADFTKVLVNIFPHSHRQGRFVAKCPLVEKPLSCHALTMTAPALTTTSNQSATVHYGDGEFAVLKSGDHVACAVSGVHIPLPSLRYWSVERQQAYAGPLEYMAAERDA